MRHDYRLALRAKGIRPLPGADKLRTTKSAGDVELLPVRGAHVHGPTMKELME